MDKREAEMMRVKFRTTEIKFSPIERTLEYEEHNEKKKITVEKLGGFGASEIFFDGLSWHIKGLQKCEGDERGIWCSLNA